jgi:hypothetical protein
VSGAELDREIGGTVAATLLSQPGMAMTTMGPATGRPVIRGLGGDRILILEDGQRPGDLSSMSGDHAVAIEPLTATQLEVVRGPMSLLYGSSAMGGVVNVVREEVPASLPEHFHGTLSLARIHGKPRWDDRWVRRSRAGYVCVARRGECSRFRRSSHAHREVDQYGWPHPESGLWPGAR